MNRNRKRGVTLVELCVILAIFAVMISILIPASQRVREAARETVCKNNVRQMGLALTSYVEVADLPLPNPEDVVGGWAIDLLPFIEQQNLENAIRKGIPIAQMDANRFQRPRIMQCPTQLSLRPKIFGQVQSAHYVLAGGAIRDAPLSMELPWAASPDLSQAISVGNDGPHYGGYYYSRLHENAVQFQAASQ